VPPFPRFVERPTEPIVADAGKLGAVPLALSLLSFALGWPRGGAVFLALALFTVSFFRNPRRAIPGDEHTIVSPGDGRVIAVGEIKGPDGTRRLRIGIFLSVFNVHVNRMPLAGRVVQIERSGNAFLAAFDARAEQHNMRCALTLETASGERLQVVQITGWLARRIVCYPQVGEWVARGARYGLIRFGSRVDVVLPAHVQPRVARGDRVRGGSSVLASLEKSR